GVSETTQSRVRGDIDDPAGAALDHIGYGGAAAKERAARVHTHDPLPGGVVGFSELDAGGDAGIVDQKIDRHGRPARPRQHRGPRPGTGHIAWERQGRSAAGRDLVPHRLQPSHMARGDHERRTRAGERQRDRAADPAPAAGDERYLAVQHAHTAPPPCFANSSLPQARRMVKPGTCYTLVTFKRSDVMEFTIRPFQLSDLQALNEICLRTGDNGADASHLYRDPDLLGQRFAAPYAVLEPDLCFVLVHRDRPCGYILGTRDSAAFYARCEREWFPDLRRRYPL